jgi:activator of HSP90 ATPase
MAKTLTQRVVFKNTTPEKLYSLYMNAKMHAESTGAPAKISDKEEASYSVSGGYIVGKNLKLVKNKMIVQTRHASDWADSDLDSIFMLNFEQKGKNAILNMVHANIPDKHADGIKKGWDTYYWDKWKLYLAGKPVPKMEM